MHIQLTRQCTTLKLNWIPNVWPMPSPTSLLCVAKALVRLCRCASLSEHLLIAYALRTKLSRADLFDLFLKFDTYMSLNHILNIAFHYYVK